MHVVCISDSVKWDFQRFTTTEQRKKDFARYAILTLEEKWGTALLMGKSRPYVPQLISIYDLKGLSWRQLSSPHGELVWLQVCDLFTYYFLMVWSIISAKFQQSKSV